MSARASVAWVTVGWLWGCGPLVPVEDSSVTAGESEDGTTTTPPPPGTTTTPPPPGTTTTPPPGTTTTPLPTDESTSGPSMTSNGFFDGFDAWPTDECDFWAQDCPVGQKCMPWANDGGSSWNALRCSPIAEDPDGVGEPCTVEGSGVSGIDSCDAGAMCWDVDPDTLAGYCVAFCMGDESNPSCEPGSWCAIGGDSVLALCFPNCDPLQQSCAPGDACYPVNDHFGCAPDLSGDAGAPGDACEFINVCDPGSGCVPPEYVPDCPGATGCCSSFCDITAEPLSCLPGQECLPWYEAGQAPPGYESLGICGVPM